MNNIPLWYIPTILCPYFYWFLVDSLFGPLWLYTGSIIYKCVHKVISLGNWVLLLKVWAISKLFTQWAYLYHTHQQYIRALPPPMSSPAFTSMGATVQIAITLWFRFSVSCGYITETVDPGTFTWWEIIIVYFSLIHCCSSHVWLLNDSVLSQIIHPFLLNHSILCV